MNFNLKKIISNFFLLIGTNIIFLPFTFFSILSILNIKYGGIQDSSTYLVSILISASSFYFLYINRVAFRKNISKQLIASISVMLLTFYILISTYIFETPSKDFLYKFILLVLPVYFFGLELGLKFNLATISHLFLFVTSILTLSIFLLIPQILSLPTNDLMTFFGGGQYQTFSYACALSFSISISYYNFYLIKKSRKIVVVYFLAFLFQITGIIFSGGRGGIILVVFSLLINLLIRFGFLKSFKLLLYIFTFSFVLFNLILIYFNDYRDRIFESLSRLFSYITDTGLSFENTSNRDIIYSETVELIKNSPIYGYGLFDYLKLTNGAYPHNFFLEILLQGGILYFFIWVLILYLFVKKLYYLVRDSTNHKLLIATFSYSFVYLMFSGTYLLEPFFWFNLAYVFSSPLIKPCL